MRAKRKRQEQRTWRTILTLERTQALELRLKLQHDQDADTLPFHQHTRERPRPSLSLYHNLMHWLGCCAWSHLGQVSLHRWQQRVFKNQVNKSLEGIAGPGCMSLCREHTLYGQIQIWIFLLAVQLEPLSFLTSIIPNFTDKENVHTERLL